jgi:hypothetical protein
MVEIFFALPSEAESFRYLIEPALEYGGSLDCTAEEIINNLENSRQLLLLVIEDEKVVAGIVVEHVKNNIPYLLAFTLVGNGMERWLGAVEETLKLYAKNLNCDKVIAITRPGLGRILAKRGWTRHSEMLELKSNG